ncbi:MAG: DNA polymerase III subunit gamma/tau [Clostridia bacterium]|nr:DNA polymerase III subunit gamma/tau [Clostridia bacterium]
MEHIALYRQFRPMTFDEIVEQKGPVSALRQSVITGKIGHAYLFSGQRGTGKTSIAKVFSRAINCENPVNGNPCNNCAICKGIISDSLMDVIEIDAASNNSVDNIRRICEEVNFAPAKASHKVYIIDEVHMLSTGAFNALLKTLEEPPKHVVFLLATTEPHRIPATIHSRCQRYDFKRIPVDSIVSRLKYICEKEGFIATDDALSLIASLSDGAMRDAISLLDQAGNSSSDKTISRDSVLQITGTVDDTFLGKMAKALIDGNYEDIINMCEELAGSGRDITRFAVDLAQYFRDLLVVRMMPDPTKLVKVQTSTLKTMYEICQNVAAETLVAFISKLSTMISDLKWTPSVRTTFEITLIQLCGRKVKVEPVPLVVPDFIAKQQAFANSKPITTSAPSTPATTSTPAPIKEPEKVVVPEAPKATEPVVPETTPVVPEATPTEASDIKTDDIINSIVAEAASVQTEVAPMAEIVEPKVEEPKKEDVKIDTPAPAPVNSIMDDLVPPPADEDETPIIPVAPVIPEVPGIGDDIDMMAPPPEMDDYIPPYEPEIPMAPVVPEPVAAPVQEEPVDPEDLPMENQIDLFSMPTMPTKVEDDGELKIVGPDYEETPKVATPKKESNDKIEEQKDAKPSNSMPLLSLVSSSFLDDIDEAEEEVTPAPKKVAPVAEAAPTAPFSEPTPEVTSSRVHAHTSLAAVMEGTELLVDKKTTEPEVTPEPVVSPAPTPAPVPQADMKAAGASDVASRADLQMIWESIYGYLATEDYMMFVRLAGTKLQTKGSSAYIVFDNSYTSDSLKQLTADPLYKTIRNKIMAVLAEIEHVYVATEKQYRKVLESNSQSKPAIEETKQSNLDIFLNAAQQNGVDIHFGDD